MGAPGNLTAIATATLAQRAPAPAPPAAEAGNVTAPRAVSPAALPGGLKDVIAIACVTHTLCHVPLW